MQPNQALFTKTRQVLLFTIFAFSVFSISSCKEKEDKETEKAAAGPTCMTLTKDQLNEWVPKYTDPGNPENERIHVLKFYSRHIPNGGFDVNVRAYNSSDEQLGNEITLSSGVACGVNLPPLFIGQSNDIYLSDLNIIKANGSLVDNFDKLILTPAVYSQGGYDFLQYEIGVKIGDTITRGPVGLPCPPCDYCKPPCPPEPADTTNVSRTDSIINQQ